MKNKEIETEVGRIGEGRERKEILEGMRGKMEIVGVGIMRE